MTGKIMLVRFIRTAMGTYFIALRHKYRRRRKEGFKHARWPRLALDSSMLLKLQANNLHYRQEIIFHYTHTQIHQHVRRWMVSWSTTEAEEERFRAMHLIKFSNSIFR